MKKTIFCTALLWVIALTGYAQSFSVPKPKGLQCGDMPSWPIAHTKKNNSLPNSNSTKNTVASKPVTSIFLSPLLKIWLMTEPAAGKDDE